MKGGREGGTEGRKEGRRKKGREGRKKKEERKKEGLQAGRQVTEGREGGGGKRLPEGTTCCPGAMSTSTTPSTLAILSENEP